MLLTVFALTIAYGLFIKKSRFYWLWCTITMLIIINTTITYADFDNYQYTFDLANKVGTFSSFGTNGFLWDNLCILFGKLGLSYRGMVLIVIFISMFLINYRIKNIKINNNIFWALLIIFPGIIQCVQLRFFLGTSIVLWGLIPLLQNQKKSTLKFLICLFIAYGIHSSCLIFAIFLLLPLFNKIGYKKTMAISIIASIAIIVLFKQVIPNIAAQFITSSKMERYFLSDASSAGWLRFAKIILIWACSYVINAVIVSKLSKRDDIEKNTIVFCQNIQKVISLLFTTIIFMIYDGNFHRFIEIGYVLLFISVGLFLDRIKSDKNKYLVLILLMFLIAVFAAYTYTPYNTVLKPLFSFQGFQPIFK